MKSKFPISNEVEGDSILSAFKVYECMKLVMVASGPGSPVIGEIMILHN